MEDLAASLMPHSHSAPLYLLYDLSASFPSKHGLAPPVPLHDDDDDGGGFEFAATARNAGGAAALRACASDVSAAAFADELLRAGALLPLSLPPRLQRPAYSAGASAATSPTSASSAAAHAGGRGGRKHRGFDPFAAALEKVRRDGAAAAAPRRARSLSPLRAAADASSSAHKKSSNRSRAPRPAPAAAVAARRARRGVRHLLCRVVMAGAAVAPKALWPRRKDGVSYRPGLLVCLGYGV
ncbi:hypothetical protein PAHAL_5G408200 [Panicum hallii]|jgi:hypothetical protein|uniref:Uncharacterized protein n=1 Tax=Panicum hallii TaxID=206008 RepID=A0A2S3HWR2_9POAL|nr:hypothetical protein PAHAL_5G408200 [Panicum hallii]